MVLHDVEHAWKNAEHASLTVVRGARFSCAQNSAVFSHFAVFLPSGNMFSAFLSLDKYIDAEKLSKWLLDTLAGWLG
ncbi:hypothetical protein ACROYT_G015144 [Oculina patagonica]